MRASLKCFQDIGSTLSIDDKPFKFKHKLLNHPAMTLESLALVLPRLPEEQVFYSAGNLAKSVNFDTAHQDHKNGLSLEQTIEEMKTAKSYIMVRSPETHPIFQPLFHDLLEDVNDIIRLNKVGSQAIDPMLYMFIASPGSVTPFHIDRYSTFLLQFQGQKKVSLYPSFDERMVPAEVAESFMARAGARPVYQESFAEYAETFDFGAGEALHIPFLAPHDVTNGPDEVSISLSIIFNTQQTMSMINTLSCNHLLRKRLSYKPSSLHRSPTRDAVKARMYRTYTALKRQVSG